MAPMWKAAVTPAGSDPQLPVMVPVPLWMLALPISVSVLFRADRTLPEAGRN